MEPDYAAWRFWYDMVVGIIVLANFIYTWFANKSKANKAAIDGLHRDVNALSTRVDVIDSDMRHLPDHDDLGEIHEKINEVTKLTSQISGELVAINRTLALINEHLINANHGHRR